MTGSDEGLAAAHGRMRAAHADRERVVAALKTAFVQGRRKRTNSTRGWGRRFRRGPTRTGRAHCRPPGRDGRCQAGPHARPGNEESGLLVRVLIILAPAWIGIAFLIPAMPVSLAIFLAIVTVMATLGVFGYGIVDAVEARRLRRQLPSQPGRGGQGIKGGQGIEGVRPGREGPIRVLPVPAPNHLAPRCAPAGGWSRAACAAASAS